MRVWNTARGVTGRSLITQKALTPTSQSFYFVRDTGIELAGGVLRLPRAEEHPQPRAQPEGSLEDPPITQKALTHTSQSFYFVRDTGIEPVTSSVSGKRATAAPIALNTIMLCEVRTGFEPAYTALQAAA